jgi:virginiamycin B lyase
VTEFPIPTDGAGLWGIAPGPDGNLWFTEQQANKIGRITPAGSITEFPLPTPYGYPYHISPGPDGNLWFTAYNMIGRITPSGSITEFPIPTSGSGLWDIAPGADGRMWFSESGPSIIGAITVGPSTAVGLAPSSGPPGTGVTVTGTDFGAYERVRLSFLDSTIGKASLGTATTDQYGSFTKAVTIPAAATTGAQTVRAKGRVSGFTAKASFTVT